jgi:hypothetical protein
MNKLSPLVSSIFIVLTVSGSVCGQAISNIRTVQTGDVLEIHFDLDASATKTYTITPTITTRDGNTIAPVSMMGTNLNVIAGNDKTIRWDVLKDISSLEGDIMTSLAIQKSGVRAPAFAAVGGGPSNAFLSMLLPGLGDVFVNAPGEQVMIKPTWIMAGYAVSVALAYYGFEQSKENYSGYLSAAQQYEMNTYYDKALYYRENGYFFATIAGAIWISDVLHVAVKGSRNNKRLRAVAAGGWQLSGSLVQDKPVVVLRYSF